MVTDFAPVAEPRKARRKHLTLPEWRGLLTAALERGRREHAIIRTVYECALRASEPGLLRLDHCKRLGEQQLFVPRGKGSTVSWVDISEDLAWLLDEWVRAHHRLPTGFVERVARDERYRGLYLFPGRLYRGRRKGVSRQAIYNLVSSLAEEASVPPFVAHPHAIKHARAQHLFEEAEAQGMDPRDALKVISTITGHKSAETAWQYYVAVTGRGRAVADAVMKKAFDDQE